MRVIERNGGGVLILGNEKTFIVRNEKVIRDVTDAERFVESFEKQRNI